MAHKLDAVSANIFCMNYDGKFGGMHYDVGTGDNISLNEMREIVQSRFPKVVFDYIPPREGDVLCTKADISKIGDAGWVPKHDILEGIAECFALLKKELEDKNE